VYTLRFEAIQLSPRCEEIDESRSHPGPVSLSSLRTSAGRNARQPIKMAATTEHEPTVEVRTRTSRRPSLHARFPACGTGKSFRVFHSRLTREGHPSLPNATLTDTPPLFTNRRSTTTTRVRRKIPTAMRKRVRLETRARPHPVPATLQLSTTRVRVDDDHARGRRRRSRVEPPTSARFARPRNRRSSPRSCVCFRPARAMPRGPTGEAREPKTSRALARADRTSLTRWCSSWTIF